jgi:hypothetical protein
MRLVLTLTVTFVLLASSSFAGHTRPGYVDGCQSADGRFTVTTESMKDPQGKDGWKYTWKDTKTGETHSGWLVGIPYGLEHFRVAYTHIFVPPGGETFAVWQTANWAPCDRKPPKAELTDLKNPSDEFRNYVGFTDRLVVYKKTGEIVKRLGMKDILKPNEWVYVNWVQGNMYWLTEYADVMTNGKEPPRCGYRYYRVSPDYSVLEFTVGPNSDARHKVKDLGPEVVNYRRKVLVSLADGTFLDPDKKIEDRNKIPARPFKGDLVKRGDEMRNYLPSLDPVRIEGKIVPPKEK